MKEIRRGGLQELVETLRTLRKEREGVRKKRLLEKQVEELEDKRNSLYSFYRSALGFLQDELKKYERKLKY